jgi:ribosomal protein S18 acetylase RimI-like enzyme
LLTVRPFVSSDQAAAHALIIEGLTEHWGVADDTLNTDLVDIAQSYQDDIFLVAVADEGRLIGTGGCRLRGAVGEIVRMSVHKQWRRRGVATGIADALVDAARARGVTELVLETQATWPDARGFYEGYGFTFTHIAEGDFGPDAYYRMDLSREEDE